MSAQLCLGTAQFGMNYGITNKSGQVSIENVKKIIEYAESSNIMFLDTAQSYGNVEYILNKVLKSNNKFQIISKLYTSFDLKEDLQLKGIKNKNSS